MKPLITLLLFLSFMITSCNKDSNKNEDKDISYNGSSFKSVSSINQLVNQINGDPHLSMDSTSKTLGDATIIHKKYYQGKHLIKLIYTEATAYGGQEIEIYLPERNLPPYVEVTEIKKLCDSEMNICLNESRNYFNKETLISSMVANVKYKSGEKPKLKELNFQKNNMKEETVVDEIKKLLGKAMEIEN